MKLAKYLSVFLCFWFSLSCKKETKFESFKEYENLVGKWKSIDGDLSGELIIKKNGKVTVHYGIERGERFHASAIYLKSYLKTYYNVSWKTIAMERVNYKDEKVEGSVLLFNATFDTVLKASGAFNTEPLSKELLIRYTRK